MSNLEPLFALSAANSWSHVCLCSAMKQFFFVRLEFFWERVDKFTVISKLYYRHAFTLGSINPNYTYPSLNLN